jgi:hypothetical protein
MGPIYEKNQRLKISCYCLFKGTIYENKKQAKGRAENGGM